MVNFQVKNRKNWAKKFVKLNANFNAKIDKLTEGLSQRK